MREFACDSVPMPAEMMIAHGTGEMQQDTSEA